MPAARVTLKTAIPHIQGDVKISNEFMQKLCKSTAKAPHNFSAKVLRHSIL